MSKLLKGKPVANKLLENIIEEIKQFNERPALAIVRVGDNPGDKWYENSAKKRVEDIGGRVFLETYPNDISEANLIEKIKELSADEDVHGILLLSHLPPHIDKEKVLSYLDHRKDVDGVTDISYGKLMKGNTSGFVPATPMSVMEIIDYYDIDLEGKDVIVIGRSTVVGLPIAHMLINRDATVEVAHSKTVGLESKIKNKDIIILSVGKQGFLTGDMLNYEKNPIIIDVGINKDEDGNMVGDTDVESIKNEDIRYTPVPGGVGAVTQITLLKNLVKAYNTQQKEKEN